MLLENVENAPAKNFENIPKNFIFLLKFKKYPPTNIRISPCLPAANRKS